jgi:fatty-acyl-CoA synthase
MKGAALQHLTGNTVGEAILRQARKTPDSPAVIFGERTWSYGELAETTVAAAAGLRESGVGLGDRVAFFGRNSDLYLIGWLSTVLVGAIHVPINFMLGSAEVAYILGHAEPTFAFADASLLPVMEEAVGSVTRSVRIGVIRDDAGEGSAGFPTLESIFRYGASFEAPELGPEDIAQIAYTSGTESAPKGAMLSHRALIAEYLACIISGEYSPDDTFINALPLYHCAQTHCFLSPSLMLGAKNVILSSAGPAELLHAIHRYGATSVFAPPTVWISLLRSDHFTQETIATVRKGYYGASIMPREVVRELAARAPSVRLWNYYGQTEIAPLATVLGPEDQLDRIGSAGKPIISVETRIVDDEMHDVAPGEVGEVVHRSPQLMSGYYKDPERTAAAFAGGWFHSGDLARQDEDGYLYIVDRKKDVINTGGENVSSREVEEALYEHPAVAEVAVIALPDPRWIESVCAVVVPKAGSEPTEQELIEHARGRLASFKVPKRIEFIDQLPKNPSGKILKRELRESLGT